METKEVSWVKCQWCKKNNALTTEEVKANNRALETSVMGKASHWPYTGEIVCKECQEHYSKWENTQ